MNGKQVMALLIAGAMLIQAAPAQTFAASRNVRTEKEKKESYMDGANGFAFRLTDELLSAKRAVKICSFLPIRYGSRWLRS